MWTGKHNEQRLLVNTKEYEIEHRANIPDCTRGGIRTSNDKYQWTLKVILSQNDISFSFLQKI